MNSEMTTIFLNRAIARVRRACEKTRASAAFHARHAGAQKRHGQIPPAREQLCFSGVYAYPLGQIGSWSFVETVE